jgi:prepilin-type N-terminal cleavage/methylation domain-containing protein
MAGRQAGFSLIESLIAVLVLSVGLLGLGQLQAGLWKSAGQLYALSEAYLLSAGYLERALTGQSASNPERRLAQSPSGYTAFDSALRAESQGRLTQIRITSRWRDTDGAQALVLLTAVYRDEGADSRWLLNPE